MLAWLASIRQDLRFGIRELIHHKTFTLTALLSLALGITAATSMYSVLYGIVIDPFPYKDVDNLVSIAIRRPDQKGFRTAYSAAEFRELASNAKIFQGMAASTVSDVLFLDPSGQPRRLRGNHISHNGFDVMGVPALLGRAVTAADENPESLAVLGYRYWRNQLGGDLSVIGRTVIYNGRPRTIVGVMGPRFMFRGADVYLPLNYLAGPPAEGVRSVHIVARRPPGLTSAQAEPALRPIIEQLARVSPNNFPKTFRIELKTFAETFPSELTTIVWVLFAAVGLLLLIACANVANLLLARAASRQREIAMRAALGASRFRLIRQLLTESLLLGLTGGLAGILLSGAALRLILAIVPPFTIPDEAEITISFPVLAFSFAACLLSTILFGLAPALHTARGGLAHPLQESGRGGGRAMSRFRSALVIAELSLAVVLLAGAGLFLKNLITLQTAPLAVSVEDRMVFRVPLSETRYPTPEKRNAFYAQFLDRLHAIPGVKSAGLNSGIHPLGIGDMPVEIPSGPGADPRPVNVSQISHRYPETLAIKLLAGRALNEDDINARRQFAVVNESFARRYFPNQSPLGKIIAFPRLQAPPFNQPDSHFEIVGIAADALFEFHNGEAHTEAYIPFSIAGFSNIFVVHTSGDPLRYAEPIRRAAASLDPAQFIDEVYALPALIEREVLCRGRFRFWIMAAFAFAGLALASIGVYGLLANFVSSQTREFGVRLALGATGSRLLKLVFNRGIRLILAGIASGLLASWLLFRHYGEMLGVADPLDPTAISLAAAVLLAVALAACLPAAVRAAGLDPIRSLRHD